MSTRSLVLQSSLAALLAVPLAAQQAPLTRDTTMQMYLLPEVEIVSTASGIGKPRAATTIDAEIVSRIVPAGTSALRIIERLPGVNVQSADAFGTYEWSTRITMRGFQTQQIGQTFDGLPLGDMSYGNWNGLNIVRAIDPANLMSTTVQQGSGALGTASANNLGGAVQYRSGDPSDRAGFNIQQMAGEHHALRTFIRADMGRVQLAPAATLRGFVSLSNTSSDKWKGGGERFSSFPGNESLLFGQKGVFREAENWQDQLNLKANLELGSRLTFTGFYNYSDKKESDYMDLSLGVIDQFGRDVDNFSDWTQAKQYASLAAVGHPLGDVAYYYSAQGARQDHLGYLRANLDLGTARIIVTPYTHRNRGGGDWHAPSYGAAYSPDPILFRQSQYKIDRMGVTASVTAQLAGNSLEAGTWIESNDVNLRRPRWGLVNYATGPEVDYGKVLRLDFDRTGEFGTRLFYLQNSNELFDRLRLSYGFKVLNVDADFRSNGSTPTAGVMAASAPDATRPSLSLPISSGILPQVGAVFRMTPTEELFGNFSENVNQYPYSPQSGVYNASTSLFDFLEDTKPERASSFDLGMRTRRTGIEATLAAYLVNYRNRLISVSVCPPTVTCATGFGNVGSVTSKGVEAMAAIDAAPGLKWTTGASYNASTFDDDYLTNPNDAATRVATAGKDVVDAPRIMATTSLDYTVGRVVTSLTGRHVDKRYFTYTNDLTAGDGRGFVPSYNLVDASIQYRLGGIGSLRDASIQLAVRNLLDESYLGSMGTNGYTARGDNQTLLYGSPRMFFVTTSLTF